MNGFKTLHEELTDLLMDNGCAVTKTGVDAIIKFIAVRDQSIINGMIRQQESMLADLQRSTEVRE